MITELVGVSSAVNGQSFHSTPSLCMRARKDVSGLIFFFDLHERGDLSWDCTAGEARMFARQSWCCLILLVHCHSMCDWVFPEQTLARHQQRAQG